MYLCIRASCTDEVITHTDVFEPHEKRIRDLLHLLGCTLRAWEIMHVKTVLPIIAVAELRLLRHAKRQNEKARFFKTLPDFISVHFDIGKQLAKTDGDPVHNVISHGSSPQNTAESFAPESHVPHSPPRGQRGSCNVSPQQMIF